MTGSSIRHLMIAGVVSGVIGLAPLAQAQNLLLNPSFESPSGHTESTGGATTGSGWVGVYTNSQVVVGPIGYAGIFPEATNGTQLL